MYCIWRITPPGSNGNDPSAGRAPTDFSSAVPFPEPTNATFAGRGRLGVGEDDLAVGVVDRAQQRDVVVLAEGAGLRQLDVDRDRRRMLAEIVLIALPSTARGNGNGLFRSWNDFASIATTIRFLGTACVPRTVKRVLIVLPSSDCKKSGRVREYRDSRAYHREAQQGGPPRARHPRALANGAWRPMVRRPVALRRGNVISLYPAAPSRLARAATQRHGPSGISKPLADPQLRPAVGPHQAQTLQSPGTLSYVTRARAAEGKTGSGSGPAATAPSGHPEGVSAYTCGDLSECG